MFASKTKDDTPGRIVSKFSTSNKCPPHLMVTFSNFVLKMPADNGRSQQSVRILKFGTREKKVVDIIFSFFTQVAPIILTVASRLWKLSNDWHIVDSGVGT